MDTAIVDDLDRQVAHCLSVDGRASFRQIAEVTGASDQTVARRYRRMRAAGILQVVGVPSARAEGFVSRYLRIRCVPGAGEQIADALARRADTAWVQLLSGATEIMCSLRGEPEDRTESVLAVLPGSRRIVAVSLASRLHMFTAGQHRGFMRAVPADRLAALQRPAVLEVGYDGPTEIDAGLFAALAEDGRASYADLAARTGWSETTVRRRVDELRSMDALDFDLELDLRAFGFGSSAWLWLSVPLSRLAAAGEALAGWPEITFAVATTGQTNLAACVVCPDEEYLYRFLTARVGTLPGVQLAEVAPIMRTVKHAARPGPPPS